MLPLIMDNIAPICWSVAIIILFFVGTGLIKEKSLQNEDVSTSLKKEITGSHNDSTQMKVLSPSEFRKFKLISTTDVSYNTKLFRFEVPDSQPLGLAIGRHLSAQAMIDGLKTTRAYTPTSCPNSVGYFELLIKSYEYGKMSQHFHSLSVGDSMLFRGPIGRFKYAPNMYNRIGLVAGGTGITPCLQVIRHVLETNTDSADMTKFTLFYQNRTEADILMRKELSELALSYPTRLTIFYFLTMAQSKDWKNSAKQQFEGYIPSSMVQEHMSPSSCQLVGLCGPSGFTEFSQKLLMEAGHESAATQGSSLYVW